MPPIAAVPAPRWVRASDQARVSATVSATGRIRSPAPRARLVSAVCRAPSSPSGATQSGSSIHSPTPCSSRNASSTQVASAPARTSPVVGRVRHVERARQAALRDVERECGPVADVDELPRPVPGARGEHLSAAGDAVGPVREPVGRVVRTDDQPEAEVRGALAEHVVDHALARGLERAVVRADILRLRVVELAPRDSTRRSPAGARRTRRSTRRRRRSRSLGALRRMPARSAGRSRRCRSPRPTSGPRARRGRRRGRRGAARPPGTAPGSSRRA